MNWTSTELAERIAGNPSLKLKSQNPLSPRQGEAPAKRGTQQLDATPAKKSKYRNRKVEADGIVFDSIKERDRYWQLMTMERGGTIGTVMRQMPYVMVVNGVKICTYYADFVYTDYDGKTVVEDVKSEMTRKLPVYRIKRKLMKAIHKIEIREV